MKFLPPAKTSAPVLSVDRNGDGTAAIDFSELDEDEPEQSGHGAFGGLRREEIVASIRNAVEANRIDLYLQPIVSLPQRKVRYYEAMSRLRFDNGNIVLPTDFLEFAESAGLVPRIDNLLLFRCVQVVRRLVAKNREIGLFCNTSTATLTDPEYFPQYSEFLQANRAIASSLILEFSQRMVREMGPAAFDNLATLAQFGFRFSLDRLTDLRIEPRELAERNFRFVKIPAALLLNRGVHFGGDIHAADFSDLLGRFGIDLIAEKIESEGMVVDLLDYDVRFGQGFLFSPPRPVRPEALDAAVERVPNRIDSPAMTPVPAPASEGGPVTSGSPVSAAPDTHREPRSNARKAARRS
jgi:cyclic-di-GMP phosphodiesterase TipF (flagellum assembly factor)